MSIRRLNTQQPDFAAKFSELVAVDSSVDPEITRRAEAIVQDVRARGDEAVLEYTNRFDHMDAKSVAEFRLTEEDLKEALETLPKDQKDALTQAAQRIREFHEHELGQSWSITEEDGTKLGIRYIPLDSVGLYVPGGKAAYPSSVLMNAMPAHVAGCKKIVMVVPTPGGKPNQLVLAAACLAGVKECYTIGGAQAIAALAYGTETIPAVDKIVGPGNAYVAAAKRYVFGTVGIDMIAGPSEILVICDGKTNPDWIAMDLFSQAEHDELAQAILLTDDAEFADKVAESIDRQIEGMSRKDIISASLNNRGAIIVTRSIEEACKVADTIAPEHLELSVQDADKYIDQIHHAGALFVGPYTCEALGDYCAGPNHVLPTSRTARYSSPLGVWDFQKRMSVLKAETSILVSMDLDGTGKADIRTGIGFFDHMLHQIARHGQIDLTVMCDGDLHIDGHHSVEDIGIAMGQCLAKALGDKAGITRFGSAYVPLDEALSRTVLDISGRPYLVWNVDFTAAMIGELDTQLPREFFLALANNARITLHIDNLRGINAHHQCESVFKSFGRAVRMACEYDPRARNVIPSTKGVL